MTDYEEFQKQLRSRYFIVGWRPCDSHNKTYHQVLHESWHDANDICRGLQKDQPGYVFFVEPAKKIKPCPRCDGKGCDKDIADTCGTCHGIGKIADAKDNE